MHQAIIINSIVCVVGALLGWVLAVASIISIANMTVRWSGLLVVAAGLVPLAFVASGIGAWWAFAAGLPRVATGLITLPWLYGLAFVLLMLVSFKR
jgi:hypothetical protein